MSKPTSAKASTLAQKVARIHQAKQQTPWFDLLTKAQQQEVVAELRKLPENISTRSFAEAVHEHYGVKVRPKEVAVYLHDIRVGRAHA